VLSFLSPPECDGDLGKLGPYRVQQVLGLGGMGVVLLAVDPQLKRTVALKVLHPERVDAKALTRFVREAQAAAGLEHDHIVRVHAVATPAEGPPYLVMQYVAGPTLYDRIRAEKRLEPRMAAQICRQVAEGLTAAHGAGLVHRDIKPANIILEHATGRAKIVDFGLARIAAQPSVITTDGLIQGTPEYMSPEQVSAPDGLDARSDVYCLGVTLYESLTGEPPFRGLPHLVLQQVQYDDPRPLHRLDDRIPRDLETICLTAMAKEPGLRYQSAKAMADDLQRWLDGHPIQARPVGTAGKVWRWSRRNRAIASLAAVLVMVVMTGFAGITWQWRRAKEHLDRFEVAQQRSQALSFNYLGLLQREQKVPDQACQSFRHALPLWEKLVRDNPDDLDNQSGLGRCLLGMEAALVDLSCYEDARVISEKVLQHYKELINTVQRQGELRRWLSSELYYVACELALCYKKAEEGKSNISDEEQVDRFWYADRSLEKLKQAYEAEPFPINRLETNEVLKPLRPQFQKWVEESKRK
jgi:hypothetical protein